MGGVLAVLVIIVLDLALAGGLVWLALAYREGARIKRDGALVQPQALGGAAVVALSGRKIYGLDGKFVDEGSGIPRRMPWLLSLINKERLAQEKVVVFAGEPSPDYPYEDHMAEVALVIRASRARRLVEQFNVMLPS